MAEKYYRVPVANSVVKLSAVEYVTPVVTYSEGNYGFRIVYTNYNTIPLLPRNNMVRDLVSNTENTAGITVIPNSILENGYNCSLSGPDKTKLETYRTDLINALTDNGLNLIDNFPGE